MSSAAVRQRRHRAREQRGKVVVAVEIDHEAVTTALVDAGLLDEDDIDDRAKVGAVLARVIETLAVTRYFDEPL